ncbi:ATP-binding protein [Actinoplanes sp. NPDC049681]|uniref:sensor histidine kinase n=1 Tax=Actinoplanes sp. NPDC049681 TaxID=3363905 RepID=UPI0037AB6417
MKFTRGFEAVGRRGVALAAATLVLGLGTGAAAASGLAAAEEDAATAAFTTRTTSVRGALDATFQRYADTLRTLVATAATPPAAGLSPVVSRVVGERLPGAHQVVVADAAGTILAQHTVDGSTPPPRTTLNAGPDLAGALALARDHGRLVAGPAHVLPADRALPPAQRELAFDLVAPVYGTTFQGWVVVAVRAPALLQQSLRAAGVTGVAAVLSVAAPDGVVHEVSRWGGAPLGARHATVDLPFAGLSWQVSVRPATALVAPELSAAAPLTMLGATLLSLALTAGILALSAGRRRAATHHDDADHRAALDRARAAEESAAAAREALREREAELRGFATAAGDRLHAPLHSIAGFTDLLLEDAAPQLDPESREFLARIGTNTRRMLTLVDELLAYSSAPDAALKLEAVDATALALEVVADRLDRIDGRRPGIEVGDLPAVLADAGLLGEVVGRLVDNAARFVRQGSVARIAVDAHEHAPGWWRIEVADRGIGVPEDHRDRIFAPFHRAPAAETYPGAGLGLALCRRIVALHGGEIGVRPNPGGGSIFWFTVAASPVAPDPGTELLAADLA